MKSISFSIMCGGCLAAISLLSACADQSTASRQSSGNAMANRSGGVPTRDGRNATTVSGGAVGGANGPEYAVRTGSNIPQSYNRRGYTTDAQDPSFNYDQEDIRLQSTNNVGDSLRSVPGVSVGGSR